MRTSKFNILYIIGFCLMACLFPIHLLAENGKTFTVVIDAGHGSNWPDRTGKEYQSQCSPETGTDDTGQL